MPPPLSTRRQLELMRDLQRLANARHAEELRLVKAYESGLRAADKTQEMARQPALDQHQQQAAHADAQHAKHSKTQQQLYDQTSGQQRTEYQQLRAKLTEQRATAVEQAKQKLSEEGWQIRSVYDAQKEQPSIRRKAIAKQLSSLLNHLNQTEHAAAEVLSSRWLGTPAGEAPTETPGAGQSEPTGAQVDQNLATLESLAASSRAAAQRLYDGWLSRLFDSSNLAGFLFAVFALVFAAVALAVGFDPIGRSLAIGAGSGLAAVAVLGIVLWLIVRPAARRQTQQRHSEVATRICEARQLAAQTNSMAALCAEQHARELVERRDTDLAALESQVTQQVESTKDRIDAERERIDLEYPLRLKQAREAHEEKLALLDSQLQQTLAERTQTRDHKIHVADVERAAQQTRLEQQKAADWQAMSTAWLAGCAEISGAIAQMRAACERLFPDWSQIEFQSWEKPVEASLAVEFGRATLDLASVKHALPPDPRLRPAETVIELPTLLTLTEQPALLVTAEGEARKQAVDLLQAVALRFFTGQPPGKVRLTLLDPAGLGEGLSPFMHLADYEEDLIAGRIWSEARDIDEQLHRLTSHMETVIQKYLRSEYDSIHEYNAQAGEVAEPFQVVVVNGFPSNFSDTAARRLVSLATGGPRGGVFVLGVIDGRQRLPSDFNLDDLKADAVNLEWDDQRHGFVWRYPAFERLPLVTAKPPSSERMVEVLRQAGAAAKDAVKVEVPFSVVAPQGDYWTRSCSNELRVPVGRAGANRLQDVRLGKGTSQHLLVAGKTGSGKSTFLHALVTSAALHFSPNELEFYLIDFKKGVEFKSYANSRLPHARVVAIESEREFGLSVLERLDAELSRRGELYRALGVQNLADFRLAQPLKADGTGTPMPRILLVIDEFQELFVEDDRLAQDATLLMDRLVRQGRAFGIHVILGTQTLAGAFSIARSTLGQIAIRVALACSEADAHLILADERNQAARFLSRPGEAIYNDQNGLTSANEPFQVVWLPDAERAARLARLDQHRQEQGGEPGEMIVFEGNAPADPALNPALATVIAGGAASPDDDPVAWLGDAVAIKPPTHARFGRHAGANLLVVGPQEGSALGVMTAAAAALARATPDARLVLLDGSRRGDTAAGVWPTLCGTLGENASLHTPANAAVGIAELAAEVARRESMTDTQDPPVYLLIWSGARFRDLRKSEDDFSFSMDKEKSVSPDKQLAEILKNGPSVGVHVLVWCDGYNQAARMFDRMTMREFAMRVAFQMSAADSSNLLDSPAASNLRQHRALYYSDETGESEKFRPYGPPSEPWLKSLSVGSAVRTLE